MPTVHYYPRKFFRLRGVAPPMRLAPRPGRAPRGWNGAYPLLRPDGGVKVTPSPAGKKRARAIDAPTDEADEEVAPSGAGELQSGHFPVMRGAVPRRRREKMRRILSDTAAAHAPLEMGEQSLDEPFHEGMEPGQQRADTLEGQPVNSDEGDREAVTRQEEAAEEAAGEASGTSVDQAGGEENARPQQPPAANSHGHGSHGDQRVERVVNLRGRPRPDGHWDNAIFPSQQEDWDAPIGSLEEEVEKELGLGEHDPALAWQRKLDRELGVGKYDPRRLFQRELERDLGVPLGKIAGTSGQVARPELRRFITPDPSRSPSKRGPPDASLGVAGDAGGTAHAQALAVGFSAHFLQNKRDEEVQLLLDSAASMREKTREETGLCAPRSLASVLEQALEVGFDIRYLASKSLDEAKALILYSASAATPLRRNSSLSGLTGEAENPLADSPVPKNVGVSGPLMPDKTDCSDSLAVHPRGGGIVSSHERALNLGFTAEFLATKTKAEAQVLLNSIASISLRTKQTSGYSASLNLASTVEYALDLGYALCFLANQSEEEIEQYVTSRVEKIEAERAIASKGANVTLSDRESDVDDDEEMNADDEDSDAGESDAEDEAGAEVQSDTSDEGSVQDEEDEEDSQSDRVGEEDISSDGIESSEEEDMISIVSSGEDQSISGESNVADESSDDESDDDDDGVVRVGLPLGMRRSSSLSSLTRERTAPSSAKASRFKSWMGRKQTISVQPKSKKHRAANEEIFRQHVEALKVYRERYGDYLVPSTYPILGGWVRMVRACYHDPGAKRSGRLTEQRREMLDEIDFQWERPHSGSHAYRTRARNITRAAVTMQSINEYNASLHQPIAPVEGSESKANVSKQIAQHVINTEQHDQARQIDENCYARGLAAGVEEVNLFNAFEEIGREGSLSLSLENQGAQDRKRKWSTVEDGTVESGLTLVRSPRQPDEVFGEWLADRKQNWRQQQLRQWKTKIASAEGVASLSTRPESIEEFGHWLAVRKAIWKEKQRRKLRMVQDLVVDIADKRPPVVKKKAKRARKSSSSPEIDYGTCGVRYRSGMWGVEVSVRSKLRYVGRFPSQENAALANRLFRDHIAAIVTPDQMPDEVNEAVKLARWTALQAVARESSEEGQSTSKNDQRSQPKEAVIQREGLEDEDKQKMQPVAPGISQRSWGKWEVAPYLYGKKRYIGSFDSLSQAHKANEVVREQLVTAGDGTRPSDEDIEQAVKKARDAARPKDSSTQKRKQSMASKAVSQKSAKTSSSSAVNSNPSGVRRAPSGRWEVRFRHGGTIQVHIGTFSTKDEAILANDMARGILLTECNGADPSSEEIKRAVMKAREKVWEAVRKLNDEDDEPPTEEDELAILLRWDESGASSGPHLPVSHSQSQEGFARWLAIRKERWRRQSGHVLKPRPIATDPKIQRESTVTSSDGEDDEPPTEEDELAILLRWDESGAWSGPHLPLSQLQSQEGFARWLAARKERWRGQSGRVLKPRPIARRIQQRTARELVEADVRAAKARAARRRRRLQLIARAAVVDSRRATFARGRQIFAEEFARTFCTAAFVEETFAPAFAMLLEASEVEAGKAQESPVP